jgi:hypothetical protein
VLGERARRRVVEDQRRGQGQAGLPAERVAQLDRGQRVEAEVGEGPVRAHGRRRVAEHRGHLRPDQSERVGGNSGRRRRFPGEPAEQRPGGVEVVGGEVNRHDQRVGSSESPVEHRQRVTGGQRPHAALAHARHVGVGQLPGHPAVRHPRAPNQRHRGQAQLMPVLGERVEEGVACRVVALPGAPEDPGSGREQDERGQSFGQLVQVPSCVELGPQHGVEPLGGQRRDDAVVEHPGGVHHGAQRADLPE